MSTRHVVAGATVLACLVCGSARAMTSVPVAFEENLGQVDTQVRFLARTGAVTLGVREDGSASLMPTGGGRPIGLGLEGAVAAGEVCGDEMASGVVSYLRGRDPSRWVQRVPRFHRVVCRGQLPGVELVYHVDRGVPELDLELAAGVDPSQIVVQISGAYGARVQASGVLEVDTADGVFALGLPLSHQVAGEARCMLVGAIYRILSPPGADPVRVGFDVGARAPELPLVIDPVLGYSSYLGGGTRDEALAVTLDSAGNVYVGGQTTSVDFPLQGALQPTPGDPAPVDGFVAKFDPTGSTLLYATYLGGNDSDVVASLDVDAGGRLYITGTTNSSDFPLVGAIQLALDGLSDVFVARLDVGGSALEYSTYLGGPGVDEGRGIAARSGGGAAVAGETAGGWPTVAAIQPTFGGGVDGFLCQLDPAGSALVFSTYLGGSLGDSLFDLAPTATGDLFVCGQTNSPDLPTVAPLQATFGGGVLDAWVARVASGGGAIVYSTYLGGNDFDVALDVDVDSFGNAHVVGRTSSVDFPVLGAFQPVKAGPAIESDGFVTKLDTAGSALVWSTFLGGSDFDYVDGVAVDPAGNVLLAGATDSVDFPLQTPLQPSLGGTRDSFALKLGSGGTTLFYSTYYGGAAGDVAASLATDATGRSHIVGFTVSTDFPTANPYQATSGGGRDAMFYSIDDTRACGDCNLDTTVNILDSLAAARHGVGLITLVGDGFSNCNVRGTLEPAPGAAVGVLDSLAIAQFAAGLPMALSCI